VRQTKDHHRPRTSLQTKDRATVRLGIARVRQLRIKDGQFDFIREPQFQRDDFTVNEYATLRSLLFYFPALVSSCLPSSPVHLPLSFLPLSSFSSHLVFSPVEDAAGFSASMDGRCLVVLVFNFTSYIDAYLTFLFCQCSVFKKSLNSRQILKMPTADAFKMK